MILYKSLVKVFTYRRLEEVIQNIYKFSWCVFFFYFEPSECIIYYLSKIKFLNKKNFETVKVFWKFHLKCKCFRGKKAHFLQEFPDIQLWMRGTLDPEWSFPIYEFFPSLQSLPSWPDLSEQPWLYLGLWMS